MIISAFCADPGWAIRFSEVFLADEFAWRQAESWREFETLYSGAACAVVVGASLRRPELGGCAASLRDRHPLVPLVVATEAGPENLRVLTEIRAEEILGLSQFLEALPPAAARIAKTPLRFRLANAIERLSNLPDAIRSTLAESCRSEVPVHTVARFRALAGLPRSTLNDQWRAALPGCHRLRIQDVLHRVELIRAAELWAEGVRFSELPERLGIGERTLERRRSESGRGLSRSLPEELAKELLSDLHP